MRDIFTLIASFVHRKTRSPGVLSLSQKLYRLAAWVQVRRRPIAIAVLVLIVGVISLGTHHTAWAKDVLPAELQKGFWGNLNPVLWALRIVNEILSILVGLGGRLATLLISILMNIAEYNDFLSSTAVANGWVVTRDIANMFFIVILLVIAFGTILGSGEYNTKMLGKLLVMAVVINFSRTIIGIMIDASQVIMLTFVNGFSAAGAGNFINAFGVAKVLQYHENFAGEANITGLSLIAASLLMGLVLMLVACWVLVTIVGTLLFRIAYLWFLLVLSPIAWLMSTFPAGKKYYAQWWDQFRDQLVVGPAMAFFLWLSLTAVGSGLAWNQVVVKGKELANVEIGLTQILTSESILSFAITVVLLVASKEMAKKLAASAAGYGTFMKGYMSTLARGKKIGVGALKTADLFQASTFKSGLEFSRIPERIKSGLGNRQKLMREKADEYRLRNAQGLRNYVPVVGGALSSVWAPDVTIEKFMQGGLRGIVSRRAENIVGADIYSRIKKNRSDVRSKKTKEIEADIATKRVDYDNAHDDYTNLLGQQQRLKGLEEMKAYAKNNDTSPMDEDKFKEAKRLGLIAKETGFKAYTNNAKEYNDQIAYLVDTEKGELPKDLDNKVLKAGQDAKEKFTAFQENTKSLQEDLRKVKARQVAADRSYMAGDVGLRQRIDMQRFAASSEANKKIDPDATKEDLVVYFTRALAVGDRAMMDAVSKRLAKSGNIEALFSVFGIRGTGGHGPMKELANVLQTQAGFDESTTLTLINRVSELESLAGSYDNANLIKIDKVTGLKEWRTPNDSAAITLQRTLSKPSEKSLEHISIKTLWSTGADGVEKFSAQSPAILELINENAKAIKNRLETGKIETDLLLRLRPYYAELVKRKIFTEETIKTLESADISKDSRRTYRANTDDAKDRIADIAKGGDFFRDLEPPKNP